MKDYYSILGVSKHAHENEIKKAYRQLSFQYHPDKTNGDKYKEEKYKEINEAYEELKDETRRKQYDFDQMLQSSPHSYESHINNEMTDIFTQLFSGLKPPSSKKGKIFDNMEEVMFMQFPSPQNMMSSKMGHHETIEEIIEDIHHIHKITFVDAYEGICAPIKINRQIIIGNQSYEEIETLYVNIPKGIDHNEIITLDSKGNIKDKQQSDVKIHIELIQDSIFQRKGMDLIIHREITFKESLLGFSFVLNHINGQQLKLNNPPGKVILNKSNKVIKNLGFTREKNIGNLIIEFQVKEPDSFSKEKIIELEKWFSH